MSTKSEKFVERWNGALQSNYGAPSITLVSGKGSVLVDSNGKKYLDFLGGIATNVLGHAHPSVVSAVTKQVKTLGHVSNFYIHPGVVDLAEKLKEIVEDKKARVFFCNSGAEANEAALKLSRKTGRKKIVATEGSFHGRTMGALSLTGQPAKRAAFEPLLSDIFHVPFGDSEAMKSIVDTDTAMVIVEPILGEAGVVMPPKGYLRELRKICDATGALLVIDCVQTGMGRTGAWLGYEHEKIKPDVVTLAKGLGGGLPLGAMIALGDSAKLLQPGDHGSTFGGNPIACASALAVISFIEKEKLIKKVKSHEVQLKKKLSKIKGVQEVRGQGLLLGIVFESPIAVDVKVRLQEAGVLVNAPSPNILRIAPALTISSSQISKFISAVSSAVVATIKEAKNG
ncbi:MAG: acetylornithine transaminase [Actinomycetota bacterium]